MDIDDENDDENERPTLPSPITNLRAFDTAAEGFFAAPAFALVLEGEHDRERDADDALAMWWVEQRRRALVNWVAAMMLLCAAVLATALLGGSFFAHV
jgi:hypothetical protein